jgi:hypothetical protein
MKPIECFLQTKGTVPSERKNIQGIIVRDSTFLFTPNFFQGVAALRSHRPFPSQLVIPHEIGGSSPKHSQVVLGQNSGTPTSSHENYWDLRMRLPRNHPH